ncbi:MAG: quinone-interacting membrane-bound oxidoreductase complex subunit QmoC [Thermoleophilia bacterium]|nr:quinone-interacting membrane-bound oxidoreductase complex subunit QmoC [Thermoleophilia bacterium]
MADENVEKSEETAGAGEAQAEAAAAEESVVATANPEPESGEPGAEGAPEGESPAAEPAAQEAPARMIQPDIKFVREVMGSGGNDLKKCFQCASCSVVCNVTPDDHPFPRKEMMWAQWGLKEKLIANPDIWLCHQCNDCTAQCPRDAKPGRVMQAVAKMSIPSLSKPGFLAKGVGSPTALLLMTAIPVIILALVIGVLGGGSFTPEREVLGGVEQIVYNNFMKTIAIDIVFSTFFILGILVLALGVRNYWGMMKAHADREGIRLKTGGLAQVGPVLSEIITHKRFGKCDETKDRKTSHLFIFYSFGLLFAATAVSVLYTYGPLLWGGEGTHSPFPTIHPVKFFGYTGAAAGVIGIGLITINRFKHQQKTGMGSYFDWLLIVLVIVLMFTGIGSAAFRKLDIGVLAYPTYFVHLVAVLFLFMYAPFSKMAHMVYRGTAMAFARAAGRDTPM